MPLTFGPTNGSDRIDLGTLTPGAAITAYAWMRRTPPGTQGGEFFSLGQTDDVECYWSGSDSTLLLTRRATGSPTDYRLAVANQAITWSASQWVFVAVSQDGINTAKFYTASPAQGVALAQRTTTVSAAGSGTVQTRPGTSWIGNYSGFNYAYGGDMAWFGLHDVELTLGEIEEAMWRGMTLRGLVFASDFESTSKLYDLSGNARALTNTGAADLADANPPVIPLWVPTEGGWVPKESASAPIVQAVGQASETETAQALTRRKARLLGMATSTAIAQPIAAVGPKVIAVGQVADTSTALALTRRKTRAIGQASEVNVAQTITRRKARTLGQVSESEVARPVVWAPKRRTINRVEESDFAAALSVLLPPTGTFTPPLRAVPDRAPAESRRPLLAIRLRGPGREWSVLGSDDARGIVAEGFTATSDRGGPVSCGFNLRRDPTVVYPDLGAFSELDAEIGNQLVFGGRVWELPGTRGAERSLSVSARGWQSCLDDDVLRDIWAHQRLSDWRDQRSFLTANLAFYNVAGEVSSDRGAITLAWRADTRVTGNDRIGITFDFTSAAGGAKRIVIEYETSNNATLNLLYARNHNLENEHGSGSLSDAISGVSLNSLGASGTIAGTFPNRHRYCTVLLYRNDATAGTLLADHWIRIKAIRIFTETAYESGNQSALKASTVVRDVLASGALPVLSSSTERVTTSAFNIPHLDTGGGYQSPRQVIDAANAYHGWNAGVDARKRLFFEPRASLPVCEVGEWSGAEFSDQSTSSAETLYNRVIVQGQDGTGAPVNVIRTATVPALDLMGVTRTMVLAAGAVLTTASAQAIGDAWLSERARSQFKGSLRVVGMGSIRDLASGRPMHPSELLGLTGQMIRIGHLIDPDTGGQGRDAIIAQVQYAHDDESASISLDNENGRLDALLARVGALQAVNA